VKIERKKFSDSKIQKIERNLVKKSSKRKLKSKTSTKFSNQQEGKRTPNK
jgi:hypothetical protein